MLIYIDKSIAQYGGQQSICENEEVLFSELAIAHQRGNCLLCGDYASVDFLAKKIGGTAGGIYSKINRKWSQTRAIIDQVQTLIVLSYSEAPDVPTFVAGKYYLLKIKDAIKYSISSQCTFVGENLSDCKFYKLIGQKFILSKGISGIQISLHFELGGGDTMYSVFEKCVKEDKTITLCMADSDVKFRPTSEFPQEPALGVTCKKVLDIYVKLQETESVQLFYYKYLSAHELENLIPLEILETLVENDIRDGKRGVEYLKTLKSKQLYEAMLCYDLKDGAKSVYKTPASESYWKNVIAEVGDSSIPRVSSKILDSAIKYLTNDGVEGCQRISEVTIDNHLMDIWTEVGSIIFTWGCANYPIRA